MEYHFHVPGTERKELAVRIGEIIQEAPRYLKVPSCAYQIGKYHLSKDGVLSADTVGKELLQKLSEAGFVPEETVLSERTDAEAGEEIREEPLKLTISMPADMFDDESVERLRNLVTAKGELLKRAFHSENIPVVVTEETVNFPWFDAEPEETRAYTVFIQKICEMAVRQKRISMKEKEIVNEKYEFRCFLLRLGLIGDGYKDVRKVLMKNLSGSAAFKNSRKEHS